MALQQEARAVSPSGRGRDEEMADAKQASLTVLGGPLAGSQADLPNDGVVTIGAAADCTFPLSVPSVGPLHARVILEGGRATVYSTGSPIHVNDNPLEDESTELNNGDILWLGSPGEEDVVMLQVILPPAPVSAPAPPAEPTPEIETQALWSTETPEAAEAPVEAPPEPEAPTGEETVAFEPGTSPLDGSLGTTAPLDGTPAPPAGTSSDDPLILAFDDKGEDDDEEGVLVDEDGGFVAPPEADAAEAPPEPAPEVPEPEETAFVPPEPEPPAPPEPEATVAAPAFEAPEEPALAPPEPEPTVAMPPSDAPADEPFVEEPPAAPVTETPEAAAPEPAFVDDGAFVAEPAPTLVTGPEDVDVQDPPPTVALPADAPAEVPTVEPEVVEPEAPFVEPEVPMVEPEMPTVEPIVEGPGGDEPAPTVMVASEAEAPASPEPASTPPPAAPAAPAPQSPDASQPPRARAKDRSARGPGGSMRRSRPASLRKGKPPPRPAAGTDDGAPAAGGGSRNPALFAVVGFLGVVLVAGGGFAVWKFVLSKPSPSPTPVPVPVAATTPAPPPAPTVAPPPLATPDPLAALPQATPTPAPAAAVTPTPAAPAAQPTPTPAPRPTPTPTPAATAAAPAPPQPSAAEVQAQQNAARVQELLGLADAAMTSRQYEAAVGHLDEALRLEPSNARATSSRARAVALRDLARRQFVGGRTRVQTAKASGGGLAGFDTSGADVRQSPDFQGRIEFEMSPPSAIAPGDTWTLRVFVTNDGKKDIDVQSVTAKTTVNGSASDSSLPPRTNKIRTQQRVLVGEASGTWADGTNTWTKRVTVTAKNGDSLGATLSWR